MALTPQQKKVLASMSKEKQEEFLKKHMEKIDSNIAKELVKNYDKLENLEKKLNDFKKKTDTPNKDFEELKKKVDKIQKDLNKIWWDYYYSWVYPLIFNLAIGAYIFRTPIKNNIHDILADLGITKERNKSFFEFWGIPIL